jgi:inhibitor of KinA sporulation pathway (predicted exonuclease)
MNAQPAAAAASASALTEAQRETIERNRLVALERRRAAAAAAAAAAAPAVAALPCEAANEAAAAPRAPLTDKTASLGGPWPQPAPPPRTVDSHAPSAGGAAVAEPLPSDTAAQAPVAAAAAPPAPAPPAPPARACSLQPFDWLAVVDFECTCDEPVNTEPREIIEFPCVLLNTRTLEVGAEFQVYLRPTQHPRLSAFCTRLTGITQEQVDAGVPLAAALEAHTAFLRAHGLLHGAGEAPRFAVATWSEWDCKVMLESETRWRRIQPPDHFRRHGSSLSASMMNVRDT